MTGTDLDLAGGAPTASAGGASYAAAGVDIAAGDRAVELMAAAVGRTRRPEVVGGIGGFAGLFRIDDRRLLATSTDGVGTKVAIAQALDRHDTIGLDLVGMVVDDVVVCGAEPLFMTDYIATGRVVPERIAAIVGGIARGCELAGCALLGGETAEHPGLLEPHEYDLAGAVTGVVAEADLLGPDRVHAGDVLVAMASSGLHSNGYSLVRHVVRAAGLRLEDTPPELDRPLGEELLEPTRIYARDCLALAAAGGVRAMSHVTGGGLAANLARVMPPGTEAVVERSTWAPPAVFSLVGERGGVALDELERTLNQGVGMVAVVASEAADASVALLTRRGVPAWVCGEVRAGGGGTGDGSGSARLVGRHR